MTRLLDAEEEPIRLTVPVPAKSPPLVLLAMMVLAILRGLALLLKMPPPLVAELPDKVELETVKVRVPTPPVEFMMPPPLNEVLLEMVELEMTKVPLLPIPPPPLVAELLERVELETVAVELTVPPLKMPPPSLAELLEKVELEKAHY